MGLMVYKYPVQIKDRFSLNLPVNARPLCVAVQHGDPVMWASFNAADKDILAPREFVVLGMGHECIFTSSSLRYVGTFMLFDGGFVGHVFEVVKE